MKRYVKEIGHDFIVKIKGLEVSEDYIIKVNRIIRCYENGMISEVEAVREIVSTYDKAVEEHWNI